MSRIYDSMETLIGSTPLLCAGRLAEVCGLQARLLCKLECRNPAGSVKDRAALAMINDAEARGLLRPGGTIIEPTSGNTGIGLCAVAAVRGYRAVIVMPDSMSVERQLIMRAYGAEVILTPGREGMAGAIRRAEELAAQTENCWIAGQFVNPANAQAHEASTGPEILADTDGQVDCFVAGVGTGGTITGTGRFLKQHVSCCRVVAVEPAASPVLTEGKSGPHGLMGIGAGFVPDVLDRSVIDDTVTVTEAEAYAAARLFARTEGVLIGISSGAALHAAIQEARKAENAGKTVVVLLPDSGERYLSTPLWQNM